MDAITTAKAFVDTHFPDAVGALLAGSVARGEATPSSDLDILIVAQVDTNGRHATYRMHGWYIEAFLESQDACVRALERPNTNRSPNFLTIWSEGIILHDTAGFARDLQIQARAKLRQGPDPLTPQELARYRYLLTDLLDDFVDAKDHHAALFIAAELQTWAAKFLLAYHRQWLGEGKWLYRALDAWDSQMTRQFMQAFISFYRTEQRQPVIQLLESVLEPAGGRQYEGLSSQVS